MLLFCGLFGSDFASFRPDPLMDAIKTLSKEANNIFLYISRGHIPAFVKPNLLTQPVTISEKNDWYKVIGQSSELANFINKKAPSLKTDYEEIRKAYDALLATLSVIYGQFATSLKNQSDKTKGVEINIAWIKNPTKYPAVIKTSKEKVNWDKVNIPSIENQLNKLRSEQLSKVEKIIKKLKDETQKTAYKYAYTKDYKDAVVLLWYLAETFKDTLLKASNIDPDSLKQFIAMAKQS